MDGLLLFLARFDLMATQYMGRAETETGVIRLIWAKDYDEAHDKLNAAFPNDEYSVYYYVSNIDITLAIM
jgi:protein subunit release factor B